MEIQVPASFTPEHEQTVIDYLLGHLRGRRAWQLAFAAYDLLDDAMLVTPDGRYTFRALYMEVVDHQMADDYIRELLALDDVKKKSPALWSGYARKIVAECQRRDWRQDNLPGARILWSYFL